MPRMESKVVPEGNDPVSQQEEFRSGQPTLADVYRMFEQRFDQSDRYWYSIKIYFDQQEKKLDDSMEMVDQRIATLERDAR